MHFKSNVLQALDSEGKILIDTYKLWDLVSRSCMQVVWLRFDSHLNLCFAIWCFVDLVTHELNILDPILLNYIGY